MHKKISPLSLRGLMTGLCNVSFCIGPFIGVLIANTLAPQATKWSYRGLFVAQWGFGITSVLVAPFMPESVPLISHPTFLTFEQVSMVACQQRKRRGRGQSIVSFRAFGAFHRKALGYNEGHRSSCTRRDGGLLIRGMFPRHKPEADYNYDHAFDDPGHVRCCIHLIIRHILL
jgi:MFS family permease